MDKEEIAGLIENIKEVAKDSIYITEHVTTDKYNISIYFDEPLPESEIKIIGVKPTEDSLKDVGMSLIDAPYFGVNSKFLEGAKWALEQLHQKEDE